MNVFYQQKHYQINRNAQAYRDKLFESVGFVEACADGKPYAREKKCDCFKLKIIVVRNEGAYEHIKPFRRYIAEENINQVEARLFLPENHAGGAEKLKRRHKKHNRHLLETGLFLFFDFCHRFTSL